MVLAAGVEPPVFLAAGVEPPVFLAAGVEACFRLPTMIHRLPG
jgi:hypothetical protein